MAQDPKLDELIDKMIAAGAKDDDIKAAVTEYQSAQSKPQEGLGEVIGGARAELGDQWESLKAMAKEGGKAIFKNPSRVLNPAALAQDVAVNTVTQQMLAHVAAGTEPGLSDFDPTGVSQLVKSDESTSRKIGRGAVMLGEMILSGKLAGMKGAKVPKVPKVTPGMAARSTTGGAAAEVIGQVPSGPKFSLTRPPTRTPSGTSSATGAMRMPLSAGARPGEFSMRVPEKPITTAPPAGAGTVEVPQMTAGLTPEATASKAGANNTALLEAVDEALVAGRTEAPGRAPVYSGTERRSPSRVSGAAEDKAYKAVRQKIAEKAAKERAKAQLLGKKPAGGAEAPGKNPSGEAPKAADVPPTKTEPPLKSETDMPPEFRAEARSSGKWETVNDPNTRLKTKRLTDSNGDQWELEPYESRTSGTAWKVKKNGEVIDGAPRQSEAMSIVEKLASKEVGAKKGVLEGFTRQPTKSLEQMVKEYGREGAAQRAGMGVDELDVRIAAGGDPAKLAKLMRDKFGAEKAGRLLGMKAEKIRAESGGGPSKLPEKAKIAIRAAAEKERAATGNVSEKTQKLLDRIAAEEKSTGETGAIKVGPALATAGAVGGGLYGASQPAKNADERTNNIIGFGLGGLALGAAPKLRLKKTKDIALALRREAFLTGAAIPKNLMTAAGATVRAGVEGTGSSRLAPAKEMLRAPTNAKKFWEHFRLDPITKTSVTDYSGKPALGKAAKFMPSKVIGAIDDTARDALKRAGVSQEMIDRYLLTADRNLFGKSAKLSPGGKEAADAIFPFQRVPANVLMEGLNELGHLPKADLRAGLTAAQMVGGYGLGKWAGRDKKRQYLASILLALAGPSTALATAGAATGAGLSGFAAGSLGGISPIPEQAFDPKSLFGAKPAIVSAYQRLTEKK